MGDGLQILGGALQNGALHLGLKIVGKLAAEFGLDAQACLAIRHAEKAVAHVISRDRIAVTRQCLRMRAAGNHLDVDQHSVAIENHQIDRHHCSIFGKALPRQEALLPEVRNAEPVKICL